MYGDCAAHVAATRSFSSSTLPLFPLLRAFYSVIAQLAFPGSGILHCFNLLPLPETLSWAKPQPKRSDETLKSFRREVRRNPDAPLDYLIPNVLSCVHHVRYHTTSKRFLAVGWNCRNGFMLDAVSSLTNHFPGFITDWLPRPHVRCRISRQPRILHGNIWWKIDDWKLFVASFFLSFFHSFML